VQAVDGTVLSKEAMAIHFAAMRWRHKVAVMMEVEVLCRLRMCRVMTPSWRCSVGHFVSVAVGVGVVVVAQLLALVLGTGIKAVPQRVLEAVRGMVAEHTASGIGRVRSHRRHREREAFRIERRQQFEVMKAALAVHAGMTGAGAPIDGHSKRRRFAIAVMIVVVATTSARSGPRSAVPGVMAGHDRVGVGQREKGRM